MGEKGVRAVILSTTVVATVVSLWYLRKRLLRKRRKNRQHKNAQEKKEKQGSGRTNVKEYSLDPKTLEWFPPNQSTLSASAKEFIPSLPTEYGSGGLRTDSQPDAFRLDGPPGGLRTHYSPDGRRKDYPLGGLRTDYPTPSSEQFITGEVGLSANANPFYPGQSENSRSGKIMYIMRGLPGSGKSTLARRLVVDPAASQAYTSVTSKKISRETEVGTGMMGGDVKVRDMETNKLRTEWICFNCNVSNHIAMTCCTLCNQPRAESNAMSATPIGLHTLEAEVPPSLGVIYSTDDFFIQADGTYLFDVAILDEAHRWNQQRTYAALVRKITPIIIDNTMTQKWEAKWYVQSALKHGYHILFVEPKTSWAKNPRKLARKNRHGVPREKIKEMLARWEDDFTIPAIINSQKQDNRPGSRKRRNRRRRK